MQEVQKYSTIYEEIPLNVEWAALLKNHESIRQFDYNPPGLEGPTGYTENSFGLVLEEEKKGNLAHFLLEWVKSSNYISLSLETGVVSFDGDFNFHPYEDIIEDNPQYRLIFYRRTHNWKTIGGGPKGSEKIYLLGWQATVNGNNFQRILFINPTTLRFTIKYKR